jgi:hypothetical protein
MKRAVLVQDRPVVGCDADARCMTCILLVRRWQWSLGSPIVYAAIGIAMALIIIESMS